MPSAAHVPPRPTTGVSQIGTGAPPSTDERLSCPSAKKATHCPSGEKNGYAAPSVPVIGFGSKASSSCRYSSVRPSRRTT